MKLFLKVFSVIGVIAAVYICVETGLHLAGMREGFLQNIVGVALLGAAVFPFIYRQVKGEKDVERLNRLLRMSVLISQEVVRADDRGRLFDAACRIAVESGDFVMAWVGLADAEAVRPAAWHGKVDGYLDGISISVRETAEGLGPTGTAVREGRRVVCNDIAGDPAMAPWRDEALKRGYRSSGSFPLSAGGEVIGALSVYAPDKGRFTDKEVYLLDGLAADMSHAIEFMEREQGRKRAEKALAEEKDKLDAILAGISDGISIQDREMRVLYQNPALKKTVGDHVGEYCYKAYEKKEALCDGCAVSETFMDGKAHMTERMVNIGERDVYVEIASSPLRDGDGNIAACIEVVRDITGRRETERALRESEAKFRALVEESLAGVYIVQDGAIAYANSRFASFGGYAREDLVGRGALDFVLPQDREMIGRAIMRLLSGEEEGIYIQFRVLAKDGRAVDVEAFGSQTTYEGRPAVIGTILDITDRKRQEAALLRYSQRLEVLGDVSRRLNSVLDVQTVMRDLVVSALELVGAESGVAGLMAGGEMVFTEYNDHGTVVPVDYSFGPGECVPGLIIETKKPYITNDAANDPHVIPEIQKTLAFQSLVGVPIIDKNGELLGCFELHDKYAGMPFDDKDVALLQSLAASAAVALENAKVLDEQRRAEEKLRRTTEKLETLVQASPAAIVVLDTEGKVALWNPAAERTFGWTEAEAMGRPIPIIPEDKAEEFQTYLRAILRGEPFREHEVVRRRKDGSPVDLSLSAAPLYSADGEAVGVMAVLVDISERKRADEAIAEMVKSLKEGEMALTLKYQEVSALNAVAEVIANEQDMAVMLQQVLEKTLSLAFLEIQKKGVIFIRDEAEPDWLDMAAWAGIAPELRAAEKRIRVGHCLCGRSAETGGVIVSPDCFTDKGHTTHYPAMKPHGHVVVPIKAKEQVLGVMTMYLEPGTSASEPDLRLLAAVAHQLAVAVENRRLFRRIEKAGAEWRETFDAMEELVTIHSKDFTIMRANKAAAKAAGMSIAAMLGRKCYELFHGTTEPLSLCPAKKMMEGLESSVSYEVNIGDFAHEITVYPMMEDGSLTGYVHIAKDITERRLAEKKLNEQAHLAMLGAEVGSALTKGDSLRMMLNGCTDAMVQHLGAAFARIWTLDEAGNVLELQASSGMYTHIDGAHGRVPVGMFKIGLIAQERMPHLTNNVLDDPRISDPEWARKEGMAAFAGYPLIVGDRLVGVMAMFSRTTLTESTINALASIADIIAVGIERREVVETLGVSERRQRALLDNIPDLAWLKDGESRFIAANGPFGLACGTSPDDLPGKTDLDIWPRELAERYRADDMEVLTTGTRKAIEEPLVDKDGNRLWIETIKTPIYDAAGAVIGTAGIARDITERRLHEERMQVQFNRMAALRSVDMAITASLDLRVTLSVLLEHVVSQLSVDAVAMLIMKPRQNVLEYEAGSGFRTAAARHHHARMGVGYAGHVAHTRRLLSIPDVSKGKEGLERPPFFDEEGFKAYMGVPLIAKGHVIGVMEVYHRSVLRPDGEWLDFLEALAGQAAIAIDNAHLFMELMRQTDDLVMAYDSTIEGWSRALDFRDKETEGHSQRVTEITLSVARALKVREEDIVHIRRGALLHDIGKMGIPDNILLKPGKLTEDEWAVMKRHPQIARDLLHPIEFLRPALDIPYCHHEKWDGGGYPNGLKGEEIPFAARIFAVVDVWDALRSDRPYRPAWPAEKTREYLRSESGRQFDKDIVDVFLSMDWE